MGTTGSLISMLCFLFWPGPITLGSRLFLGPSLKASLGKNIEALEL